MTHIREGVFILEKNNIGLSRSGFSPDMCLLTASFSLVESFKHLIRIVKRRMTRHESRVQRYIERYRSRMSTCAGMGEQSTVQYRQESQR
jgi:hypothetical protein